ncbi:MAG TPA: ATP-binding protein [Candidatus Polarisedimenticolia bacterium]|nr:ATP-binding protein [Candidatus Polarisedimenticolia bacterium]
MTLRTPGKPSGGESGRSPKAAGPPQSSEKPSRTLPLKWKLMMILLISSSVTLTFVCLSLLAYDLHTTLQSMTEQLTGLAEVLGAHVAGPLIFNEVKTSEEILATLRTQRRIRGACLLRADGDLVAGYIRDSEKMPFQFPKPEWEGARFEGDSLRFYRTIKFRGDKVGSLYLESDTSQLRERLVTYLGILGGLFLLSGVITLALSSRLQKLISGPILDLLSVIRKVSRDKNYSLRATIHERDEIGLLVDGFNSMLVQIQRQDEELRIATERAILANRTKSMFLANVSHELRTPLNAIIGYGELLQEEIERMRPEEMMGDLDRITQAGRHLLGLINDVLDLSKIEAGKMKLHVEAFDPVSLIREVGSSLVPLFGIRNNELTLKIEPDLGVMRSDSTKFRQILINLISNANKFTENGLVVIEARRERSQGRDWIYCEVRDTGIGIRPEQLAQLFQPFTQADSAAARSRQGTGLGLAITRSFCQMMGGTVEAEGRPRRGSIFRVRLPAEIEPPQDESRLAMASSPTPEVLSKVG